MKRLFLAMMLMASSTLGFSQSKVYVFKSLSVEEYAKAIEDTTIVRLDESS